MCLCTRSLCDPASCVLNNSSRLEAWYPMFCFPSSVARELMWLWWAGGHVGYLSASGHLECEVDAAWSPSRKTVPVAPRKLVVQHAYGTNSCAAMGQACRDVTLSCYVLYRY